MDVDSDPLASEGHQMDVSTGVIPLADAGHASRSLDNGGNCGELPMLNSTGGDLLTSGATEVRGEDEGAQGLMVGDQTRQTITLSIEEAAHYLIQQQGITTQAIEMEDGSYQLFDHPVIQVQREDGTLEALEAQSLNIEVLQALQGELVMQLQPGALDAAYSLVPPDAEEEEEGDDQDQRSAVTTEGLDPQPLQDPNHTTVPSEHTGMASTSTVPVLQSRMVSEMVSPSNTTSQGTDVAHTEGPDCEDESQEEEMLENIKAELLDPQDGAQQHDCHQNMTLEGVTKQSLVLTCSASEQSKEEEVEQDEESGDGELTETMNEQQQQEMLQGQKSEAELKEADLAHPIPLSNQTVITVNGKKCVLSFDSKTQQLCAYPIKITKNGKRRGRPRMSEAEKVAARQRKLQLQMEMATAAPRVSAPSEKSSAAETLLELSNIGADGVRRSGRARKKAKLLDDYEELEDSEDDGMAFEDNEEKDPDISLDLTDIKQKKPVVPKREPIPIALGASNVASLPAPAKRGRGRPRRYPHPGQQNIPKSIPAVMLPTADGQTLVMTPISGLQHIRRQLPQLIPKPSEDAPVSVTTSDATPDNHSLILACSDADPLPLDTPGVLDSNSIIPQALQGDSIPLVGDTVDPSDQGDGLDTSPSSLLNLMASSSSETDKPKEIPEPQQPTTHPTVIQIPDNLLASLGFKKDPIKIGLKASERELEKLKCPKCDFQGYYTQQYRNHIATHGEDIQKCKCCSFLSLDSEELLQHFKEYHPRCICTECGYMAEHAYIIKRHMMRHDVKSCTCHICGKVYKDMYILKMHIKMVHMPAEVLFECDVCSKKFTRKAHLKRHIRIHEPEKPYKCSLCDYRGCERSDISKHMLIHQEPKHACERCGKTFRHIKNKELHVKRHYGQRDYKCGVCDFFGYTFTDIRKHIERKHQDIKTLICDRCGLAFRNEMALKEHHQTCNVMMIEQVLAIPTSGGRTSQATIQIPAHNLGPHINLLALDGTSGEVTHTEAGAEGRGVSIMVTTADSAHASDQHLGLVEESTVKEEEEEEELEEDEEEEVHHVLSGAGEEVPVLAADGKHYISTSSGIHLVASAAVGVSNSLSQQEQASALPPEATDTLASLERDASGAIILTEQDSTGHHHHLMSVENGGDSGADISGESKAAEILASIEEWGAAQQDGSGFMASSSSASTQVQLSTS